ncbi:hypothetical protein [Streptomyces sp. NPDC048340]|uniref:hypothetical protein n=1 Tax=Streptomyces sp. NPDC048340 TaxID=3365537 RepID=UPI00371C318E
MTKLNGGVGGALLAVGLINPPPFWTFAGVAATAALLNVSPGRRSVARWATVGYRRLRERTAPDSMTSQAGATETWALYPDHGTMQDPYRRQAFHTAFARALTFAGEHARSAGIQVHATHHVTTVDDYSAHTQTISVHVPRSLGASAARVLGTLEAEFDRLGVLIPVDVDPVPEVVERGPGWVALEGGRHAATARITGWPTEADGDLMSDLLLGTSHERRKREQEGRQPADRSMSTLYRPLPVGQSRRSAKWSDAFRGAFTKDQVKLDSASIEAGTTHAALVQGDVLVDLDAYITVWGDSPESVAAARQDLNIQADVRRLRLDWLAGQQHRAHVMTSPHGAQTQKGAVL